MKCTITREGIVAQFSLVMTLETEKHHRPISRTWTVKMSKVDALRPYFAQVRNVP